MTDVRRETTTTSEYDNQQVDREDRGFTSLAYIVYFIFGVLIALLLARLVFKLLGANPTNGFVNFVYDVSAIFVAPFAGIFGTSQTTGVETTSVFEPAIIIAIIVYSLIAWGIVTLIRILSDRRQNT